MGHHGKIPSITSSMGVLDIFASIGRYSHDDIIWLFHVIPIIYSHFRYFHYIISGHFDDIMVNRIFRIFVPVPCNIPMRWFLHHLWTSWHIGRTWKDHLWSEPFPGITSILGMENDLMTQVGSFEWKKWWPNRWPDDPRRRKMVKIHQNAWKIWFTTLITRTDGRYIYS